MPNQLWILGGGGAETHSQANRLENKIGLFSTTAVFVYILFPSTVVFLRWFTFCKTFGRRGRGREPRIFAEGFYITVVKANDAIVECLGE